MISVIVPVYKVERFLPACLDSLLGQTYTGWECILVDDGSPDRSGEICRRYAAADPRFRVIGQTNSGVSAARNTGIAAAVGDYLAFLDADDRLDSRFLQILSEQMEEGADLAAAEYRRIAEDGSPLGDAQEIGRYPLEGGEVKGDGLWLSADDESLAALWECGLLNSVWGKLYRRDLIEVHDLRFDTDLRFAEDMRFAAGYAACCSRVALVKAPLYLYLWREGSLTTAPRPGMLSQRYRALTAIAEDFAKAGRLSAARAVRDRLDSLNPETFLAAMPDPADQLALLREYCALDNYPAMLKEIRRTRSTLTYLLYKTRSPRILRRGLAAICRRREGGKV